MAARALTYSSSSEEEDNFSAFKVMPRPTVLSPASASSQETGGSDGVASSDEIGEDGVLLMQNMNGVPKSPPPQRKKNKTAKGKAAAAPPPSPAASEEEDASAAAAANSDAQTMTPPPAAAADSDAETMTPPPASAADLEAETLTPPHTAPADEATSLDDVTLPPPPPPQRKDEPYDAEEHLKERSDKYPHLWQMVLALEKEHSLPSLKKAFLKLTEARAAKLNGKVKILYLKEVRTQLRAMENDRAVVVALMELIP